MAKHKVEKTPIHCLISRELKEQFNAQLDKDGRTLTDVFAQMIRTYIQGGEVVDKMLEMQLEIQKLKLWKKRLEYRLYKVYKSIYQLAKSGNLDKNELDKIEFDLLAHVEKSEQPKEIPAKRKRGRPRKEEALERQKQERQDSVANMIIDNAIENAIEETSSDFPPLE